MKGRDEGGGGEGEGGMKGRDEGGRGEEVKREGLVSCSMCCYHGG